MQRTTLLILAGSVFSGVGLCILLFFPRPNYRLRLSDSNSLTITERGIGDDDTHFVHRNIRCYIGDKQVATFDVSKGSKMEFKLYEAKTRDAYLYEDFYRVWIWSHQSNAINGPLDRDSILNEEQRGNWILINRMFKGAIERE